MAALNLAQRLPLARTDDDAILDAFLDTAAAAGLELYAAQEQAILELLAGKQVILATPTGSGKSLVALALQFACLARGQRAFYTCPIKALVSEKFFALCHDVGPEHVGMLTGDASINPDAPLICCTQEVLANQVLRRPANELPSAIIMDEFHYYADRERGMAWQIPLLLGDGVQFLLMSATLGDTSAIETSLRERGARDVAVVASAQRPVPLEYEYREIPIHETIQKLVNADRAPVYIVNFTQREAAAQAQNLMSVDFCTKEHKRRIAETIGDFRFDTPFGKDVSRLVRHGVGIHHAGLLPKYRLLVEQLTQAGLLKIICGTDTLGVGVNVPIRSVLFTRLSKYDGQKEGLLSVRDFKQIAGRAGRKGFDDRGTVVCQAPEHVIENRRLESLAAGDPKKRKKLVRKKPPPGFVPWKDETFHELTESAPEPLESRFEVTHAVMLSLLQRAESTGENGYGLLMQLIARSHESWRQKKHHRRHARVLFRALRGAAIVKVVRNRLKGNRVVVNELLQHDFSLNHTLSLYLLDTLPRLDRGHPDYALDVLGLVEAILENPRVILLRQIDKLKSERLLELKAEGVEYEQRMEELDKIEHPKPNRDFIYDTFNAFTLAHPWVGSENIKPKSIAREMYEVCASFNEYVKLYGLQRSEGVLLRHLSGVYRTLLQNVPHDAYDDQLHDVLVYLRVLLARTDSSLVTEWEDMLRGKEVELAEAPAARVVRFDPRRDMKAFRARVRAEMHLMVSALAQRDYERAAELFNLVAGDWTAKSVEEAVAPFYHDYERIVFDASARLADKTLLEQIDQRTWRVRQVLLDPLGDNTWTLEGDIDLPDTLSADTPLIRVSRVSP